LDALAEQRIFSPLDMPDSTLDPLSRDKERIVPTGYRPGGELIWSIPNDEKADVAYASGIQSGLAGLFSTVPDILHWIEMVFGGGRLSGNVFLSPRAIKLMTLDCYPGKTFRSALAWGDDPTYQSLHGARRKEHSCQRRVYRVLHGRQRNCKEGRRFPVEQSLSEEANERGALAGVSQARRSMRIWRLMRLLALSSGGRKADPTARSVTSAPDPKRTAWTTATGDSQKAIVSPVIGPC
jgi:CubicO group peptidase (beta-lactamase class C family)